MRFRELFPLSHDRNWNNPWTYFVKKQTIERVMRSFQFWGRTLSNAPGLVHTSNAQGGGVDSELFRR